MYDHHDDERRTMARCEADYLREPERGRDDGCDDGCDECGEPLPDDLHLCDECAAARDDDFSDAPYSAAPMPADDADVIPF